MEIVTFQRTPDIFLRALRVISPVFFVLTYGFGGGGESTACGSFIFDID